MAETQTANATGLTDIEAPSWKGGVVAGVVGGAVMAAVMLMMNPAPIEVAIPSLYGLAPPPNGAAGLVVHLSHGAVLGVAFAGLVGVADIGDSRGTLLGAGVVWGVVTWVVLAALVMPAWLSVVGSPAQPPLPNFALPSLLWHVVYGVVAAAVLPAVDEL
ncbi:histidine kinase [Haloglomus halophilum]|uniref:histidine kinase n=1 Tax=Haloglomus halophilum TaxID=2962672 RepID=UPI0020C9E6E9|nr:histidine kinase [Haloglomus halophilum]